MNAERLTVLLHDGTRTGMPPRRKGMHVLFHPDLDALDKPSDVFVLAAASRLPEVAEFVRVANQRHYLRTLFVRSDTDSYLLPQLLDRARLRTLRNMLVHEGPELPARVLNAWRLGAEGELIARASVVADRLLIVACDMERIEVPFVALPALAHLTEDERAAFEIASDGSYLHWPDSDVHLDLETLRCAVDPERRRMARLDRLRRDRRLGRAIAELRRQHALRQSDIAGLSARHVRRIEAGYMPSTKALETLARAHDMSLRQYLDAIADRVDHP